MSGEKGSFVGNRLGALGRRSFLLGASASLVSACSFIPREPFTAREQAIAEIPGIPNARFWIDGSEADFRRFMQGSILGSRVAESFDVLALSGGAYDGAFGAGVVGGWTLTGTRPKFAFVTGVSAGALIAPLAFLGPDYDAEMRQAFSVDAAQVLGDLGGIFSLLGTVDVRHGMLEDLVDRFVNERLMEAVAAEHARGRRLLILSTNLDAQRGVVWDMGAIAAGGPQYRQLFRNVLVASASIPGLFGPTYIEVYANGRYFREMHVDGGATNQFFILPDVAFVNGKRIADPGYRPRIWIIMNNHITPQFEVVEAGLLPTVSRSMTTLLKSDAKSTLLATETYFGSERFNLTFIDNGFDEWMKANPNIDPGFNSPYMQALYRYGYDKALSGRLWSKSVPLAGNISSKRFQEVAR
jgi:hypothetical protein